MPFCKNCGTQVSDEAAFCPKCGTAQKAVIVDTVYVPQDQAPDRSQESIPNYPQERPHDYRPSYSQNYQPPYPNYPPQNSASPAADKGGFGWGFLGCCIPIVGLILFLVWKDTKPKSSKAAGIGALVGVISWVVFYVLIFAVGFLGAMAGAY